MNRYATEISDKNLISSKKIEIGGSIFYTEDPNIFKIDPTKNRELNQNKVKEYINSINENGIIIPLVVSSVETSVSGQKHHLVLDGQHRLAAVMALMKSNKNYKISIPFVVHKQSQKEKNIKIIKEINSNMNPWRASTFTEVGKKNGIIAAEVVDKIVKMGVHDSVAITMLSGDDSRNQKTRKKYKDFDLVPTKEIKDIMQKACDLIEICLWCGSEARKKHPIRLQEAVLKLINKKNYNHTYFLTKRIDSGFEKIDIKNSTRKYFLNELIKIYNRCTDPSQRIL